MMRTRKRDDGFTLLEMVVAVLVVSVMTAVVVPHLVGISSRADKIACQQNQKTIKEALTEYYLVYNKFPDGDTSTQLQTLVTDEFLQSVPKDPGGGVYTIDDSDPSDIHVSCSVHGEL